jgi:hypothetical protein
MAGSGLAVGPTLIAILENYQERRLGRRPRGAAGGMEQLTPR